MKQKLLTLVATVLIGLSSAWAAVLPTSGSGEYLLRNVQTGTYLKGDAYYGTKAVVWDVPYFFTLTYVSDGVYTIKTQQNNGGEKQYIGSGADPYVDSPVCNMTFTEVDATNHYYTINNGSGNLYTTTQTEDGASFYKVMAGSETGDNAKWQLVSREEMVAALDAASPSNPVDASFLIYDAAFDANSVNAGKWTKSNVDLAGGGNAGRNAESWNKSSFSISQTVTGLPNGKYKATCYGYYRWNSSGGGNNNAQAVAAHGANDGTEKLNAIFFAGDKEEPLMSVAGDADARNFCASMTWADNTPNNQWQAAACFTQGFYLNTIENIMVTDGTLNIGVKKTTQAGTDWCVFDEFKLYYLGVDLDAYKTTLATKRSEANDILTSDVKLNAEVKSALQTAYTNTASVEETKTALEAAISLISGALTNATASIGIYTQIATVNTSAATLDEAGQASYATTLTAYNEGTLTTVAEAETALRAAAKAQTTDGANMTYAINNWDFLNCANDNFPGWTISAASGNKWVHGTTAVEYWNSDHSVSFDYYQEISGLPAGQYTISASMWNTQGTPNGNSGAYGTSDNSTVFAGVTDDCDDNNLHTYSTDVLSITDGNLRLGVKNNGERTTNWFGVDWIKLTLVHKYTDEELAEAALDAILAEAYSIYNNTVVPTVNVGTDAFQYNEEKVNTYQNYAEQYGSKTPEQVKAMLKLAGKWDETNLTTLLNTIKTAVAEMQTLNAPSYGERFYIVNANSGQANENKAAVITDGTPGANNPTGYGIATTAEPSAQIEAFTFTQVEGNTYNISVQHGENVLYLTYGSLNGSAAGWNKQQIQLTPDETKKGEFIISATETEGVYNIYNTVYKDYIDIQDGGSLYTDTGIDKKNFKFSPELIDVPMVVLAENKWATFCAPFDVEIPEGVTAYTVDDVLDAAAHTLAMTPVETTIPANTPVVLYSETYVDKAFTGVPTYDLEEGGLPTKGLLMGVYIDIDGQGFNFSDFQENNDIYLLSKPEGANKVAFYHIEQSDAYVPSYKMQYKACLMLPRNNNVKALFFNADDAAEATAIEGIEVLTAGDYDAIYNAAGAQVKSLQKGVNIIKKGNKSYKIFVK